MNDNSTGTTRPSRRTRGPLLVGASVVAGLAVMAATAPVVAGNLVDTKDLAKGAVTSPKIAKKGVKTKNLADGAVKTPKLADGAVTSPKLGDGSVSSSKLAAGSVTRSHLAADLQPLWAVVWGGPTITRGKGAVSVAFEGSNSQYRLTFDRDISKCSYTATLSQPDSNDPERSASSTCRR